MKRPFMVVALLSMSCGGEQNQQNGDASRDTSARPDSVVRDAGTDPRQTWLDYCLSSTSCGLGYGGEANPVSECVESQFGNSEDTYSIQLASCVADAGPSCARVKQCATGGDPVNACLIDGGFACDGSVQEFCDLNRNPWAMNCADYGETCSTAAQGCSLGSCNPATTYSCKGNVLIECNPAPTDGGYSSVNQDCSKHSATCGAGADGGATCIGSGPACSVSTCDGTTLVQCQGGHEARVNCGSLGLTCVAGDGRAESLGRGEAFCGLANNCNLKSVDSCKSGTLQYCDLGKVGTFDCIHAGWKGCESGEGGTHCVP